jgi:hypothetical protein
MNTINIFGSSEKLLELGDVTISQLLKSNKSIGINNFGIKYQTDYILFSDTPMADLVKKNYNGQIILTNYHCYKYFFKNNPEYIVGGYWEPNSIEGSVSNSAFFALWWAVNNGYTNINLYGILDSDEYITRANGDVRCLNIYSGKETIFQNNQYLVLKELIENGFNGRANIQRPLRREVC